MDRGALWATACGIAKSWTQRSDYYFYKVVDTSFSKKIFFFKTSTLSNGKKMLSINCFEMTGSHSSFSTKCLLNRKKESEVTQSCPTLCNPMDSSLPQAPPSMGFYLAPNPFTESGCLVPRQE